MARAPPPASGVGHAHGHPTSPAYAPSHAHGHRAISHSLFSKFKSWLRLVRVEHALMSAAGVFIGLLLASGSLYNLLTYPLSTIFLALLVPILINIGAFALNDYWDVDADLINERFDRPLVFGALSRSTALTTGGLGLLLGILAAGMLNPMASAVAALFAILSLAYNRFLKDWPLAGNLAIAASMAIAFAYGGIALGFSPARMPPALMLLTIGALFAGLGRELVKTVQDMEGDKAARQSHSLPHVIGARASLVLAAVCYVLFAAAAALLLISGPAFGVVSGGLFLLSIFAFLTMASELFLTAPTPALLEQWRRASLWSLLFALAGIAMAAL